MTSMEFVASKKSMESMNSILRETLRFGARSSAGVRNSFCFEIERICFTVDVAAIFFLEKTDQPTS